MGKKGKSYTKVPPYKRYGASRPSNVNCQFVEEEETVILFNSF